MVKTKLFAAVAAAFVFTAPMAAYAKKAPQLTPMELQAIQSKEFQTSKETLFASAMSVFQDLGYTINSAEMQTGFITANSPMTNKTINATQALAMCGPWATSCAARCSRTRARRRASWSATSLRACRRK